MNWAAYLKHLLIALKVFNYAAASNKKGLICYICNDLGSAIWAQSNK